MSENRKRTIESKQHHHHKEDFWKKYNRSSCVGILPAIYWFGGCWHRSVETSTLMQKCRMNRCCRMAIAFSFSFSFSTFSTVMLGIVRLCMELNAFARFRCLVIPFKTEHMIYCSKSEITRKLNFAICTHEKHLPQKLQKLSIV